MNEKLTGSSGRRAPRALRGTAFAFALVLAAVAGGLGAHALMSRTWSQTTSSSWTSWDARPSLAAEPVAQSKESVAPRNPGASGFADIVEVVKPAVFGVQTKLAESAGEQRMPRSGASPRRPDGPAVPRPGRVTALGSGFFISADGYAVTNNHVVEGSPTTEIQTDDKKTYTAKVVGTDPTSDLALLKVDGRNDFAHVQLADKSPRVGEWVLAIGNPFGLGGTVTAGIVSARERNVGAITVENLLQIDAPINKGDSGGPTFDLSGRVIGVNTMIFSPSGGSIGIAFAVPAETVRTVIPQLMQKGAVTRGWIGVQMQTVTPEIADGLGLPQAQGALVAEAQADGPAAKAGLVAGDVIVSIDGEAIKETQNLSRKIGASSPGTTVRLGVLRQGAEQTVTVMLGELPVKRQASGARKEEQTTGRGSGDLGMKLAPASSIPGGGGQGAIVTNIDPHRARRRAGRRAGRHHPGSERQVGEEPRRLSKLAEQCATRGPADADAAAALRRDHPVRGGADRLRSASAPPAAVSSHLRPPPTDETAAPPKYAGGAMECAGSAMKHARGVAARSQSAELTQNPG